MEPNVDTDTTFEPVAPGDALSAAEVTAIITNAANSIDAPFMSVAVVDRIGNILGVWNRDLASDVSRVDNEIAVSLARTAAFLSHSQAPLTSRTGQFISTFHFPARFDTGAFLPAEFPTLAPLRATTGVQNTPQGPLWQIDASNRGVDFGPFDQAPALPPLLNPDGSAPSPGFTALPGAIPLYKNTAAASNATVTRRLVGGVGVYITDGQFGSGTPDPEASEFAALNGVLAASADTGAPGNFSFFPAVPFTGAVYLVGVLLPAVDQTTLPPGYGPGNFDPAGTVVASVTGLRDPDGDLIDPRDSSDPPPGGGVSGLTMNEVRVIVDETIAAASETHAAIRLPADAPTSMVIAITDLSGEILALHRMPDATLFSVDIAITKARNTVYYSNDASLDADGPRAGQHPLAGIVPPGTAITCRTLGFLTQPTFPPGIDGNPPGPLFDLALENRDPVRFDQMGFAPIAANQSGLILFPGSAPLYKGGELVGAIGVSGDGVEQDDWVTFQGIKGAEDELGMNLEPPTWMRADNYQFEGVTLPYFKFPQHPGG